jgi:diamine N-acetyltransferase
VKPGSEAVDARRAAAPSWTIRPAALQDAPRLASFGAALFRQAYEPTHPEPTLSAYLANAFAESRVAQSVADRASMTLLVETADGSWLGYAALREGGPSAQTTTLNAPLPGESPLEIVRFYVDGAWQGRGVAQALMHACEEEARARGCDVLWLQAWQQAPQALRFYAKSGFATHGTTVFQFGERADADFILARPVGR